MNQGDIASSTPTVVGVAGATYTYFGLPLSAWVSLATLIYLVLQIIVIAPKVVAAIKRFFKGGTNVEGIDDPP